MFQRRLRTLNFYPKYNPEVRIFPYVKVILLSTVLFAACGDSKRKTEVSVQQKAGPRPATRADGYVVRTQTILDNIELPGTLVANEATQIHPEVAGKITGIYF